MNIFRRSALTFLILALAGCAQQPSLIPDAKFQQAQATCAQLYANEGLNPIRDKIVIGTLPEIGSPSLAQLSNDTRAADAERDALRLYDSLSRQCRSAVDEASAPPGALLTFRSKEYSLLGQLYGGQIDYGKFNRDRSEAIATLFSDIETHEQLERAAKPQTVIIEQPAPAYRAPIHCYNSPFAYTTTCF